MQRHLPLGLVALATLGLTVACSDGDRPPDAAPAEDGSIADGGPSDAGPADAGPWVNPGCTAEPAVFDDGLTLDVEVDLREFHLGRYQVHERITVRPDRAGDAISLFGVALVPAEASHGYVYDGNRATFCTGAFDAGDEVTVEVSYLISEEVQMFPPGSLAGMRVWGNSGGDFSVGPFTSPYFAPTWLFVPQTVFWIDEAHAGNVAADRVALSVVVPDSSWTVVGPGASAAGDGTTVRFEVDRPMPLYTFSFSASPRYERFELPATATGVALAAGVFPSSRAESERHVAVAGDAVDWMTTNVGPFRWDETLSFAEVPGFGGGMEHTAGVWLGTPVLDGSFDGDYVAIHEAVHHWWGNEIQIADWPHFWMSEGFTEWTTVFAMFEEVVDAGAARELQERYRRDAARLSYPATTVGAVPGPLRFPDGTDIMPQVANNLLYFYRYGAAFLEMIHQRLVRSYGTDLLAVLRAWYAREESARVTTEQFRDFLGSETGDVATWTALFDDWVYLGPAPTLELGQWEHAGGRATFEVRRVDGADQDLSDLEISVIVDGSPVRVSAPLPAGETVVAVDVAASAAPTAVIVDPDGLYIVRLRTEGTWDGPPLGIVLPE